MRSISFGLITLIFLLQACNNPEENTVEKPIISVSILPQKYFIEQLAGNEFVVNVLLPPGNSPASYDPTPRQLRNLSKSELYLKIGHLGFELAWMESIKKNHKDLKIIDLSAGIDLIQGDEEVDGHEEDKPGKRHVHDHGGIDPHIWMSPKSAVILAENTANAIIRFDPVCQDLIRQNLAVFIEKINALDQDLEAISKKLKNKKFIIFHPALTYLARDYGLEQIPMEFEGKEPSAAYMKQLIDLAKAENISRVFIQKEFDQAKAQQITKDLNAKLIQIDPLAEDWEGQMRELIQAFKK